LPKELGTRMLQIHYRIMAVLNAIGTAWVAGITVLISSDILGRALFSSPIIGVPEIVKVSVVAIVWLQMAHTLKIGGHLRSDVILGRLSRRGRSIMDLIGYSLGAIIFGLVVYSGWSTMIMAWELGEFEGEQPVRVPTYPLRSIVLLGAGLTSLQFFLMAGKVIGEMLARRRREVQ
jgi:TRAP-type mannitol/chloroaromatic compound transport system permease small subunit